MLTATAPEFRQVVLGYLSERLGDEDEQKKMLNLVVGVALDMPEVDLAEVVNQTAYALEDTARRGDVLLGAATADEALSAETSHIDVGSIEELLVRERIDTGCDSWLMEQNLRTHAQTLHGLADDISNR